MTFKNSIKLLCANFAEVWKLLVYHIISIGVCVGFLAIFGGQYIDFVNLASAESGLADVLEGGTLYGASFATAVTIIADFVIAFFKIMFTTSIGAGIFFCVVVFYLLPLLMNVGKIVTCELVYGYMSSCQKQSFTGTYLKTLRISLSYSSIKVLYSIPFNFLTLLSIWGLTRINFASLNVLFPFVFVILVALVLAFKSLLCSGWAPAKVVYNNSVAKSYRVGMRAVFRNGLSVFSTAFIIYLLAIVVSLVLGLYAIIIILPIISPLVHIFEMTAFFQSQGMRFYVDGQTIVSPKKLEEVDKIEDAKYLL
ncbi:MAG: hypothetical protein J6K97_00260 [Clostridia bacterium]|nr:hypothetical protein [Clostridia bacterium]